MTPTKSYEFDFRGKRLRLNGEVQDKYSVGYLIGGIDFHKGLIADYRAYAERAAMLLALLRQKAYENVTIIA